MGELLDMSFDLSKIGEKLSEKYKDKDPELASSFGHSDVDYGMIKMPEWWQEGTRVEGIPFGKIVMLAGRPDSGKTSGAMAAMKAAAEQGCAVIYCETERKTSEEDLK